MRYKVKLESGNNGEYFPNTKYKIVLSDKNFRITEYKLVSSNEVSSNYGFTSAKNYGPNDYFAKVRTYNVIKNNKRNIDFDNDELLFYSLFYIIKTYGYDALRDIPAVAIPLSFSEEFFNQCDKCFESDKEFKLSIARQTADDHKINMLKRKLEEDYAIIKSEKEVSVEFLTLHKDNLDSKKFKEYYNNNFFSEKANKNTSKQITAKSNKNDEDELN